MGAVPRVRANGIEIEYESIGDPSAAPLLLISGLGSQLIGWDEEFCGTLAARGFRVIRFDNRDVGLSTWFDAKGVPDIAAAAAGNPQPVYALDDMAADAAGLLDALEIRAAHVVGASMGGFIAQLVALNHPDHVLSLTSIMSGPNGADEVPPAPDGAAVLLLPAPPTREQRIEQSLFVIRALRGSRDPLDEEYERAKAARAIDRAYHPAGYARQLVAILAAPSRVARLRSLRLPTLVIHGREDILIPPENGRIVAGAVRGARLMEVDGMGHDLPKSVWPDVADAIAELARQAAQC